MQKLLCFDLCLCILVAEHQHGVCCHLEHMLILLDNTELTLVVVHYMPQCFNILTVQSKKVEKYWFKWYFTY